MQHSCHMLSMMHLPDIRHTANISPLLSINTEPFACLQLAHTWLTRYLTDVPWKPYLRTWYFV